MTKLISEILQEISSLETKEEKHKLVDKYCGIYPGFILFMKYLYEDPQWAIQDIPIYKKSPRPIGTNNYLIKEIRSMYVFLEGKNVRHTRRAELLIQLLESLDPADSELVEKLILRTLEIPGYSKKNWIDYSKLRERGGKLETLFQDKEKEKSAEPEQPPIIEEKKEESKIETKPLKIIEKPKEKTKKTKKK